MKNFFKVTSIILLVLFAASCSNGLLSTSYNSQTNDNGKCLVSFSITNFASNSRTILPTDPQESMITKFIISGTSGRGETYNEEFSHSDEKVMVLSYALWDLILEAYDANDNLILKGRTIQDLSNGASGPISFTLSEKGVDTNGDVTLGGNYTDLATPVVDYTISGLYDIHTGELVTGTTENKEEVDGSFSYTTITSPPTPTLALDPGEYIFKVQLMGYGEDGAIGGNDDVQYGVWSDVVKVAPGRTTTNGDITIPQSVLGSLPVDPSDLMAYLVNDSENNDETYKVNLKWSDNSNNETHFLIKVYEYSDKATPIADAVAEYQVLSSIKQTQIELKLGKLYDVTIEAVNRLGSSAAVDRVSADTGAETGETAYVFASADANYRINRYKITYDLNGGSYDNGTTQTQNNVVNYHTYGATPVTLPQNGVDSVTIKNGENPLQNWVKSDDSSAVTDADGVTAGIQYDGFANLAVTAVYDLSYDFTVTLPEYAKYELPADNITVKLGEADPIKANAISDDFDVSAGNKDIVLTIADTHIIDDDTTIKYDEFKVILVGGNKTSSLPIDLNGNTYKINTKNLDSANYIMVAIAKAKDTNDWYSYSFSFTIKR